MAAQFGPRSGWSALNAASLGQTPRNRVRTVVPFYTLATGRWPYVGDDVLVARLEREPDDPHPYAPHLSEFEIEVLMKALARHRPERYPDAGELLGALLSLEG